MRAIILAGGEGTRLRPLTNTTPKPLLPIGNRPFLEHQLRLLAGHCASAVTLLTGYLPDAFGPFAESARRLLAVDLDVSREESPLGTAGAARSVLDRLDGSTLVLNGDVLTDLDVGALVAFHRDRGAVATLALTHVEDAGPYGLVPLDRDGRVRAFLEKPPPEVAREGGLINAGTYVIEPRALADIPAGVAWSFERQVFPSLLERGEPVYGFASPAYWIDIGTPARYLQAHRDLLDGRIRIVVEGRRVTEGPGAPALLAVDAAVARGARAGPYAVVGAGASIAEGAVVERSVLLPGCRIGEGATVRESILGADAIIDPGARVEGTVLGDGERCG